MGRLDLASEPEQRRRQHVQPQTPAASDGAASHEQRKFVGIKFNCCGIYTRIYANRDGTAYEGRCPKCGKPVRLKIGEGGTSCRFFEAN